MFPLTGDTHDDTIPLFMQTKPSIVKDIDLASPMFISLVDFVKEGNTLDDNVSVHACAFLDVITPDMFGKFEVKQILFELVPTHDGSCSGFTSSIVVLLTSSNERLVKVSMSLLSATLLFAHKTDIYAFLETGFFSLLPQTFYEQEIIPFSPQGLFLMDIIQGFMTFVTFSGAQQLNQKFQLSEDIVHLTFIDKCFRPIEPFLKAIFRDRRRIPDSEDSLDFSELFGSIVENSSFLEPMTEFVLSSSFTLAYTDSLHFFETQKVIHSLLQGLLSAFQQWFKNRQTVQKRGRQILTKLCEEGLSDETETLFKSVRFDPFGRPVLSLGTKVINQMGGNVQDWATNVCRLEETMFE
ncbi:hypothetical protein BLNAU_9298 [Blattamonas nauphoetae]|uniref:Uncharacterized protein n=1 Tax=Blattamonas nauphoetae TaxID=2049346 RepID=A0ABQ9XWA7_9EUKA|nr:hypothetical protein BLNAU_9298 [Blattamonas nauphoetae]